MEELKIIKNDLNPSNDKIECSSYLSLYKQSLGHITLYAKTWSGPSRERSMPLFREDAIKIRDWLNKYLED